jgi:hypothetical protein
MSGAVSARFISGEVTERTLIGETSSHLLEGVAAVTMKAIDFAGAGPLLGVDMPLFAGVLRGARARRRADAQRNRAEHFRKLLKSVLITALDPSNIMSELGLVRGVICSPAVRPACAFSKSAISNTSEPGADPRASLLMTCAF